MITAFGAAGAACHGGGVGAGSPELLRGRAGPGLGRREGRESSCRNCRRGFKKNGRGGEKKSVGRVSGLSGNSKTNCHALPV